MSGLFYLLKGTFVCMMFAKESVKIIQTQENLEEFSRFQKWFKAELNETIENVRYGIQSNEESTESAILKIELYKYLQNKLGKQNEFSFELFEKYKEIKKHL